MNKRSLTRITALCALTAFVVLAQGCATVKDFFQEWSEAVFSTGYFISDEEIESISKKRPDLPAKPLSELLVKAQAGDAQAQVEVGKIYLSGAKGLPVDYFTAYDWFHKAEQQGNAEAMYQIGNMYENGEIGPVDFRKDPQNYSEYLNAITNIDYEKALNWYIKAADKNHIMAYDAIVHIYKMEMKNGKKVTPNNAEVRKWNQKWDQNAVNIYKQKANNGDGDAMIELFWVYMRGLYNVKADTNEAQKWYDKAVEHGGDHESLAFFMLELHHYGNKKQKEEAVRLYRQAAEKNNKWAQFLLGEAYATGKGVKADITEAARWFRMAAENGEAYIQYRIGEIFASGIIDGVGYFIKGINKAEAAKCFSLAAENGDAMDQFKVARKFYYGQGVEKDYAEAFKWAYKAVTEGRSMFTPANNYSADNTSSTKWWYINACQLLGVMYREGQGVPKDEKEADKWGINPATNTNPMILSSMTERLNKFCDEWNERWRQINP